HGRWCKASPKSKLSPMLQRGDQERRSGLRRLDDILESLEQLNLHDKTELPDHIAEALVMLGIEQPHAIAIPQLVERVWVMQQPGRRTFGADSPIVLLNPFDGSLNAKQGVPLFGLMLAVLDGPLVSDSYAGVVFNLATGEHCTAIRNEGARRNGEPVTAMRRSLVGRIELLGLESTPRNLKLA